MDFSTLLHSTGLIAAHRGARCVAPENTLSALKASVGRCDFIEIDVLFSKEGISVVMHDDTLDRTTNVAEIRKFAARAPYLVCDFTIDELMELDYGYHKSHKEPLLTLRDAFEFIKESDMCLNVEVKDMSLSFDDETVVKNISKEIKESGALERLMISSFRHEYLPMFKKELGSVITAALVEGMHPENLVQYLKELGADAYHFEQSLADKETVGMLKKSGFLVGVYTVNDSARAQELFKMGVNYIFSDSLTSTKLHVKGDGA